MLLENIPNMWYCFGFWVFPYWLDSSSVLRIITSFLVELLHEVDNGDISHLKLLVLVVMGMFVLTGRP